MNTTLSAATCGLFVFAIFKFIRKNDEYSVLGAANGVIVGLIAVSSSPNHYYGWGSIIIGALASGIYIGYHFLF